MSRCSDAESMIAALKTGIGIGPVPTSLAHDQPGLIRCFDPPEGTDTSSWLVISPEAWRRPEVKAFSAFFAPRFIAMVRQWQ